MSIYKYAVATLSAIAAASSAQALDLCSLGTGIPCLVNANSDSETNVEAGIFAATGVNVDLALYGRSNENPDLFNFTGFGSLSGGTWDVIDDLVGISYVTVKAGTQFSIYDVGGANFGNWTLSGLVVRPVKPGNPPNYHLSFWTMEGGNGAIPEPTTWAMLIAGFGMVGMAMRRRQRVAATAA